MRLAYLGIGTLFRLTNAAVAQEVLIHHATPAAVLEALKAQLLPQGFKLRDTGNKGALFTLDRGYVAQQGGPVPVVRVVIELQVRYKLKAEGLQVTASEEAVGATGHPSLDFRRHVESREELAGLQTLLDRARVEIEARPAITDSVSQRDSTLH
jgi:hypothetical protein